MDVKAHWEQAYATKDAVKVSWFRPHLELSLELIVRAAPDRQASILDLGTGQSTLVDDLLELGYGNLTAVEISQTALDALKKRVGLRGAGVTWVRGDVLEIQLPETALDVWHDRAVFHFLTEPDRRRAYMERVESALKRGGSLILSTFGHSGPERCSGLATMRYDAAALEHKVGERFRLVESSVELHETPSGAEQQFLTCWFRLCS
jgi:SAM-dependent methyltransferase